MPVGDGGVGAADEGDRWPVPLKVSQLPSVSGAESRSTVSLEVSRPEPVSVPQSRVSGTVVVVYQGPPVRSTLWPVGAVVSGVRVKVEVAVRPAAVGGGDGLVAGGGAGRCPRCRWWCTGWWCRWRRRSPKTVGKPTLVDAGLGSVAVAVTVKLPVFVPWGL